MGSTLTLLCLQRHPTHRYYNIIITPKLYSGSFRPYNLVQSKFLAIRWPRAWVTVSCWRWTHASARAQRTCEVPSLQYPTVRGSYIIVERLFPLFYSSYPCRSVIWLPADPSVSCVFKTTTFSVEMIYLLTDLQTTSEIPRLKNSPSLFFLWHVCLGMKTPNVLRSECLRSYVG